MRNLTEVSLKNQSLVWYFIVMTALGGIFSYINLGRMEDPSFTIREMVVTAAWPGASADQMARQVTDKLEKRIQDTPGLDILESETYAGFTVIYVMLRDDIPPADVRPTWRDVRNFCEDIKGDLPDGVYGPYYDDRFDDVFGSIYALTGDGFSYEEMRHEAENIRQMLLGVDSVQKVELLGVQSEKIYVEIDHARLAGLGLSPQAIADALNTQNQLTPTAKFETASDNVYVRVTGVFDDLEAIKNLPIDADGRVFRLSDVATVERRFVEPAEPKMFFDGEPAIGIAVSMEEGGNILRLGDDLRALMDAVQSDLPLGLEIHQVSDQPAVVEDSIGEFVNTLREAIIIVLGVSFLSLGLRTGLVVAGCIPLVLAGVFVAMFALGIDLHKVSLGALIISLGLLVDDAIIAVEMMSVQLERGMDRFRAACYAFEQTAKPMLTGTLITCAGFIPVAFSVGVASEFCNTLFPVIVSALMLSWIASVMIAPLYGYRIIRVKGAAVEHDPYQNRFYKIFRRMLESFLDHRWIVLSLTAFAFAASVYALDYVNQEFFPPSLRPELIVEMTLPEGSSMAAAQAEADRLARFLDSRAELISNYSHYVGEGAPMFVLTIDQVLERDNYAQFVIVARDIDAREQLTEELRAELDDHFPNVRSHIKFIPMGPPADYPIMLRVSGYDVDAVKKIADEVADRVAANPNNFNVHLDWIERSKILRLELDQDKLRTMGLSSHAIAQTIYTEINGAAAAQFYIDDRTIDIELRLAARDRQTLSQLKDLPIYLGAAGYVPLEQIAKITLENEDGLIKRRNLRPTITVCAEIKEGTADDATQEAFDSLADIRERLPLGCQIDVAGALEDSDESMDYLLVPLPAMIFIIMTLLMFQLRSAPLMLLTLSTAPLGLIGVTWVMLLTGKPLGFIANLGVLALSGMIIRNSVILIDQIQKHLAAGETPWAAVVDSAVLRFRPIMLTAAAAILGMVPLMSSNLWGPMAVAIAGGLSLATVLTLLVLPAMYAAVFNVRRQAG